jgi:CubicO group peptidase (beta-lactamase class C family)
MVDMQLKRKKKSGWMLLECLAVAFLIVSMFGYWVMVAGLTTVKRTIQYNFSGIDDYRIFPQRRMLAASQPFRFDGGGQTGAGLQVSYGKQRDVVLAALLERTDTTAFLFVKNDRIVTESYFAGYDSTTPSLSFSMAKSFLSILAGCALADGYFKSLDQSVTDFVPELGARGFSEVTLKHLLQMTSGIDYSEPGIPLGIHDRFYYTDHLEQEILNLKLKESPGTRFEYKSGDVFLLTLALKRALGKKNISEYMQERLWQPLGMEHDGIWSIDHAPNGLEKTGCCLAATARDFAKFGRLYLNQGVWSGKQIVPADWVKASNQTDLSIGSAWNYQRMWWRVAQDRTDFMANGHLGQFLYINPRANVVIVRLGKSMGGLSREEWIRVFISLSEEGMK